MSQINYYTAEGLQKLKDELNHLRTVERPSISEQIGEARDKGDLSENAEYDAAKEAQGILEMKISKMEAIVANARLIDETHMDNSIDTPNSYGHPTGIPTTTQITHWPRRLRTEPRSSCSSTGAGIPECGPCHLPCTGSPDHGQRTFSTA